MLTHPNNSTNNVSLIIPTTPHSRMPRGRPSNAQHHSNKAFPSKTDKDFPNNISPRVSNTTTIKTNFLSNRTEPSSRSNSHLSPKAWRRSKCLPRTSLCRPSRGLATLGGPYRARIFRLSSTKFNRNVRWGERPQKGIRTSRTFT